METTDIIHITCPKCQTKYKISKSIIPPEGRMGTCKKCQTKFRIKLKAREEKSDVQTDGGGNKYCPKCNREQDMGSQCYVCGGPLKSGVPKSLSTTSTDRVRQVYKTTLENMGVQITAKFFVLMWLLFFTKPKFEIDGEVYEGEWKKSLFIPLQPGNHLIKVYFPYFFMSQAGLNSINVDIQNGETLDIEYNMNIPFVFAKGQLQVKGITNPDPLNPASTRHTPIPSEPWYKSQSGIIWLLILLWPVGIPLMWMSDHFTFRTKVIVSILFVVFFIAYLNN